MRMVFVASHPDAASGAVHDLFQVFLARVDLQCQDKRLCSAGLVAFELPFAYITGDKFKQPVLGCNNLAGRTYLLSRHKMNSSAYAPSFVLSNVLLEQGSVGRLSLEVDRLGPSLLTIL